MSNRESKAEKIIKEWYYEAYGNTYLQNAPDLAWYIKDNTVHIYTHDILLYFSNDKELLSILERKLAKYKFDVQLHEFSDDRITRIP